MKKPTFNFKTRILRAAYTLLSLAVLLPAAAEANPVVTISGCPNFKTFTQGAWGANPSGTNPASFLSANFATAFPSGLTLGCTNKIVLTSATAVHNFLPQGSTARALNPGTLTNPSSSAYNNVLAGQLAAAIINVTFDSAFSSFAPASANLKDLVISSGPFFNKTVSQVINFANQMIGGCYSAYSATDLNTALTAINSSYDNGTMAGNYLVCPIQITSSKNNVTCNHGNNGSICISSVSGGAGSGYTYSWSTGSTASCVTGLTAGTYSVTITDAGSFTKTFTFNITEPPALIASSVASPILCYGGSSTVTVSGAGGITPYTGTGTFSTTVGSHTYSITDANGCPASTTVSISQPDNLTAGISATPILCHGGSSTITVTAAGGTTPYSGTGTYSVSAGAYHYTVTDHNGCTATTAYDTVSEPSLVVASSSASPILCFGGSSTVTISGAGGIAPYTGTGTFSTTAGSHTYSITDVNGCPASTTVSISQPENLTAGISATPILCHGASSTITVTAAGGTTPYSGTGTYTVTAGVYHYTVTDYNGCSATTAYDTITEPSLVVASSSASPILCYGGSSTVTVSGAGGIAPYTGTGTFSTTAGSHTYSITDANGCPASTTVSISQPEILTAGISATAILCHGGSSTITVTAAGGTTPYSGTGTYTVTAGAYHYTVTDYNGCSATSAYDTISEPASLTLTGTQTEDSSCNGGSCSGTATVSVSGGTPTYSYAWSVGTSTGSSANSLCSGTTPTVTITDAHGCTATHAFSAVSCTVKTCSPLKTFTQGGWGAAPSGLNPGTYLHANFAAAFPSGITIGGTNTLHLSTAADVTAFLPSGGTPRALTCSLTNPGGTYSNTLAGQLIAATLNVGFDYYDSSFAAPGHHLGDMYLNFSPFVGVTVNDLLIAANRYIGGGTSTYCAADLNTALTYVNENYDNGTINVGHLNCTTVGSKFQNSASGNLAHNNDDLSVNIYPNPAKNILNIEVTGVSSTPAIVSIYDMAGKLLYTHTFETIEGNNKLSLGLKDAGIPQSGVYILQVKANGQFRFLKLLVD